MKIIGKSALVLPVLALAALLLANADSSSSRLRVLIDPDCPLDCLYSNTGFVSTFTKFCGFVPCVSVTQMPNGDGSSGIAENDCTTCLPCGEETIQMTFTYAPGCGPTCCGGAAPHCANISYGGGAPKVICDAAPPGNAVSFTTSWWFLWCGDIYSEVINVTCAASGALLKSMTITHQCECNIA
jgi:hypothetical protein